ncbi:MAG TPA: site-specific integrase [Candidatus Acidoferrum sp.]|nr:site-specific integrase [Candidatus Acidoferrum sp.]
MAYMVDGKQHPESTKTTNKRLAQKILNIRLTEIIEGRFRLPKSNPPKLREWAAQFLESIPHPNTKRTYSSCINTLNGFFGSLTLAQVSPGSIEKYKAARTKAGAGPAIINRNLAVLRRMMKLAARQRLIARSPFDEVDFMDEKSVRRQAKVLSFSQQNKLEAVASPLLRTLIVLLTETGLRVRKEGLSLKWEDVDLLDGVLYVRESKTPAGRRALPMTKRCGRVMAEWMNLAGPNYSPYVFANPNAPAIHLKSVRKTWASALKAAKLDWRPIYDLRATFATRLRAAGNPDSLVSGMLGHASPSTLGPYAKLVDEFSRQAIQKLENLRDSHLSNPREAAETLAGGVAGSSRWVN